MLLQCRTKQLRGAELNKQCPALARILLPNAMLWLACLRSLTKESLSLVVQYSKFISFNIYNNSITDVQSPTCGYRLARILGHSFDAYLWGFVNYKPIKTQYKSCQKIPAKTAKSEMMSKDMVMRGFRQVGPIVVHSFMQAAGLTNDHLVGRPQHHGYASMAS